jgi:hypothetical protein
VGASCGQGEHLQGSPTDHPGEFTRKPSLLVIQS